jgi:hypothetical protein
MRVGERSGQPFGIDPYDGVKQASKEKFLSIFHFFWYKVLGCGILSEKV